MATQTSNLGLTKPSYAETADIAVVNSNMDIIDSAANGLENGMAIVANGNTHAAITSGQFVYVRNHGTLSEGLYTANSNISANATLTSSNLSAVSGGGLNSLNEQMANISTPTLSYASEVSYVSGGVYKYNRLVVIALRLTVPAISSGAQIATGLPIPSQDGTYSSTYVRSKASVGEAAVTNDGYLVGYDISAGTVIINLTYIAKA